MEPDRRQRISELYHAALKRPREEQGAFLAAACADDEALRQEVASLLAYDGRSSPFLETPAAVAMAAALGRADIVRPQIAAVGPYRIVGKLGEGGMGEVYRARDTKLGRDVAIKILPPHFTGDPERRARFAREARLLATLNHPHIGAIYGLEETDGVTALVLELVEGPTLADRLERGPVSLPQALTIARQIAEALDTAHEKGIVHRDLKPANIVLQGGADQSASEVRAKVLDFGLAKPTLPEHGDAAHMPTITADGTQEGRIVGSPAYMSPEQARGAAVDKRTDVWAFGCVLFEMLAGRRAFERPTVTDTIAHILERDPDWTRVPAGTPAGIRKVLERCLQKDPHRRLRDIADATAEIDDAMRAGATSSHPAAADRPPSGNRERLGWIVAGVVGIALLGTMLFVRRPTVSPPAEVVEFLIPPPDNSRFTGTAPEFEISPDGRHVVFAAAFQGTPVLWIRSLTTSELRRVPGTDGALRPFWRPDSQVIGFFADNQLKTIGLNSSSPVVLCASPVPGNTAGGTWNSSDVIVFSSGNRPLSRIRASDVGGEPSPATVFEPTDGAHRWPVFLPDGQHFLFLAQGSKPDELRIGSLASGPAVSLGPFQSHAAYAGGHLLFVRGGSLVAQPFDPRLLRLTGEPVMLAREAGVNPPWQHGSFSVSAAGHLAYTRTARAPSVLEWLDRQGKTVGTVGGPGVYFNLDISPNERFVAISQLTQRPGAAPEFDIRVIDLARANAPTRVTDDPAWDFDPAWSPDGRVIVFNSNRPDPWKGQWGLFMRAMDGSGQDEPLTNQEGNTVSPDWSRDGQFIVYNRGIAGNSDLWVLPVKDGGQPAAFVNTQHNESNGAFSPDGRWIAYHTNASGRNEIYVKAFPAQPQAFPVSRDGGFSPRWRGDGKELFFLSLDGSMMAVDIDTTKEFVAGVPRKLFSTHLRSGNNRPYAVTRDGQRFLIPQIGEGSPITVVLNWNALLVNKRP